MREFLVITITLIFIFTSQGQVWASEMEESTTPNIQKCEWCWLLSTVVPGTGQMVMGETGKGLGFLFGFLFGGIIIGFSPHWISVWLNPPRKDVYQGCGRGAGDCGGASAAVLFLLSTFVIYIWNVVDAIMTSNPPKKLSRKKSNSNLIRSVSLFRIT